MCGIVGFLGRSNGREYLLEGLKNLEYRGYDSAGIGFLDPEGTLTLIKEKGNLQALAKHYIPATEGVVIHMGIGHTRWATHGEPSALNAHPIRSFSGRFIFVHNGIIENYYELKEELIQTGISFITQTDTEILANYIDNKLGKEGDIFPGLVELIGTRVKGSFAAVCIDTQRPQELICMRKKSPMSLGLNKEGDFLLASDPNAFPEEVTKYAILPDNICMRLQEGKAPTVLHFIKKETISLDFQPNHSEVRKGNKEGYEHYMLKEIREQPSVMKTIYSEYIRDKDAHDCEFPLRAKTLEKLPTFQSVALIGCGTSFHAALLGTYIFEHLGWQVFAETGGEYKYREGAINPTTLYIFLSQSGETADLITTIEKVREGGGYTMGITNVMHASISTLVDDIIFMKAGPELSVASTKAFTAQLVCLTLLALWIGRKIGRPFPEESELLGALRGIDSFLESQVFSQIKTIQTLTREQILPANILLFIGRNVNYPIALEGALKLKEISYLACQAMPMGELKHGTIALIDPNTLSIAVESRTEYYEKFISNVQEILARKGKVLIIQPAQEKALKEEGITVLSYPRQHYLVNTFINAIFLQLLAYYTALCLGVDIDRPRNLAKSVTVE